MSEARPVNSYTQQHTYTLTDYFDVWGNEDDGWTVNNSCPLYCDLVISDEATDKEILTYLKATGYLTTDDMRKVYLQDDGDMIEIVQRKGDMPLGRLSRNY